MNAKVLVMGLIKSPIIRRKPELTKPTSLPASDELLPAGGALDGVFHLELQFPVDELKLIPTGIALATKPTPLFYPPSQYSKLPALQYSITPLLLSCMRALIQRVTEAAVVVDNATVGEIGLGLLVLLGIEAADSQEDIEWLAGKIIRLRIFPDGAGAMNQSLAEVNGQALVVSQFTLFASTKKGNRPSFIQAAPPELADRMYKDFCQQLEILLGKPVQRGVFGAHMSVRLINDGPVTIWMDSKRRE
jgi:D-tyrosyl-tRNA(Tyr) deacylase